MRYLEKKQRRVWKKNVKYDCRKRLAEGRPRIKGRFVSHKSAEYEASLHEESMCSEDGSRGDDKRCLEEPGKRRRGKESEISVSPKRMATRRRQDPTPPPLEPARNRRTGGTGNHSTSSSSRRKSTVEVEVDEVTFEATVEIIHDDLDYDDEFMFQIDDEDKLDDDLDDDLASSFLLVA
jgi:hypothetical protein